MVEGALFQKIRLTSPAPRQVVTQLRYQHRGRLLTVVAYVMADPTDVKHASGGKKRIQHELAIIVATSAVSWAILSRLLHQVEVASHRPARVVPIVHTEETNDLERDRPHGHWR